MYLVCVFCLSRICYAIFKSHFLKIDSIHINVIYNKSSHTVHIRALTIISEKKKRKKSKYISCRKNLQSNDKRKEL